MCNADEPKAGDTQPCPLCQQENEDVEENVEGEGHDGTWTYTMKEDRVFGVAVDGEMPESTIYFEWVCSRDTQHNRQSHQPL